jgi:hypothetical protein
MRKIAWCTRQCSVSCEFSVALVYEAMEDNRVQSQAIWQALTTVNAPLPLHIDAETLMACLLLNVTDKRWRPHVRAFFGEVGVEILMDMVVEGSVTFENFAKAISFWGVDEDYENVRWAWEMAAASMTKANGTDA